MNRDTRVALITGGTRGIGAAIAQRLASTGFAVALVYRANTQAAAATIAEIEAAGGTAVGFQATIGDPHDTERLVRDVLDHFGYVDVLVSNAGLASRGLDVAGTSLDEVRRVFEVCALGAFQLCRLLVPQMRERPRGDVILISSVVVDLLPPRHAPYAMAKAALEVLATTLAKEEAPNGIRVNVVAPGLIATEMGDRMVTGRTGGAANTVMNLDAAFPFGRSGRPEDIAAAVAYLTSDEAAFVTGQRLGVHGGAVDLETIFSQASQ